MSILHVTFDPHLLVIVCIGIQKLSNGSEIYRTPLSSFDNIISRLSWYDALGGWVSFFDIE